MSTSRVKEIEEQLAYLNWRKMQNERSVRSSLETSRAMKSKDVMIGVAKSRRGRLTDFIFSHCTTFLIYHR
jgi:hypothetical protein